MIHELNNLFRPARLTRVRIALAVSVALVADGLQIPFAVPPAPEIIDVIAALLTVWLLGFHLLLLPTFLVEFIPVVGLLPTWTGCVVAVIALRKREEHNNIKLALPLVESPRMGQPPRQVGNGTSDQSHGS